MSKQYVIESRGPQGNGVRYSPTGTPEGTVYFASRAEAMRARDEIEGEMPSKYLPLVVTKVEEARQCVGCFQRVRRNHSEDHSHGCPTGQNGTPNYS